MKSLSEILIGLEFKGTFDTTQMIHGISPDSRMIRKGFLFIAIKGSLSNGHDYIQNAIENGAEAIIGSELLANDVSVPYLRLVDPRDALARCAANFYDHPSKKFKLIGVTGTNGKTSVASLLFKLAKSLGKSVGLISTIQYQINEQVFESKFTTPGPEILQGLMQKMVEAKCDYVFMEVSSHAIDQKRVAYLDFDQGIFTNISHDHLDYHGSFRNYLDTKKMFFDTLKKDAHGVVNVDDKHGEYMLQNSMAKPVKFALKKLADHKGKVLANDLYGLHMKIDEKELYLKLTGLFNAYNIMAVYSSALRIFEVEEAILFQEISNLNPIEGRMDVLRIMTKNSLGIVDYAHTPDALKNVLKSISEFKKNRIITIIGCGGDRDKTKRPMMAKIASVYSDLVILTSDNPRTEDPEFILDQMENGLNEEEMKSVLRVTDRDLAIKMAVQLLQENDILLVAGKGHEKYQEVKGVKTPFDDKEKLLQYGKI